MKLLKSILQDLKSFDRIIVNRWHLHAPIAFVIGCALYCTIGDTISDTYVSTEIAFKIFVPSLIGYVGLWSFEALQAHDRIIGELERFESAKDLWVGEFFLVMGVVVSFIFNF
jgi:hypothetical protein